MKGAGNPQIIIYTGDGKGKTCAAMGQMLRALGQGGKCAVAQFIKDEGILSDSGEWKASQSLGVTWKNFGCGFTWVEGNNEKNRVLSIQGWEQVKRWISTGCFDMIILDEFTYACALGYLDVARLSLWLEDHKGKKSFPNLVITGRDAPSELIKIADIVSEIKQIKHPLAEKGRKPLPMIEF
ncbi:MAG: cob(I)yrinic acid a,c-diamide adenosyltransferase [Sphaerochaetaceae bacterium]